MKNLILFKLVLPCLFISIIVCLASCGQGETATAKAVKNVVTSIDVKAEEAFIKNLIAKETEYFYNGDSTNWASSFVQEPYLFWVVTPTDKPGEVSQVKGWETMNRYMGTEWFSQYTQEMGAEIKKNVTTREDWMIQVRSEVAWASFKQIMVNAEAGTRQESTETRVLEKIDGTWKLAMQSTLVDFKNMIPSKSK